MIIGRKSTLRKLILEIKNSMNNTRSFALIVILLVLVWFVGYRVGQDIGRQKRIEEELVISNELNRCLFNNTLSWQHNPE